MMALGDIAQEYERWLAEQRDTPAKRWCLEHPPTAGHLHRVVKRVRVQGFGLTRLALAVEGSSR